MYVDNIKLTGKKQNISPTWKILMKDIDLAEPTSFLDHFGVALKENVKSVRLLCIITQVCSNQGFLSGLQNCQKQKLWRNLMPKHYFHGIMTWKVMQRNAWKDIEYLRIRRLSNYTKSKRHAWIIINPEKKKMGQLQNYLAHNVRGVFSAKGPDSFLIWRSASCKLPRWWPHGESFSSRFR